MPRFGTHGYHEPAFCYYCGDWVATVDQPQHPRIKHSRGPAYECVLPDCKEACVSYDDFTQHIQVKHGEATSPDSYRLLDQLVQMWHHLHSCFRGLTIDMHISAMWRKPLRMPIAPRQHGMERHLSQWTKDLLRGKDIESPFWFVDNTLIRDDN